MKEELHNIMYCIIWKHNGKWQLFTNEVFLTEKEAQDYAVRNKFKKSVEWKIDNYKDWFKSNS